jgi:hypothetical protein
MKCEVSIVENKIQIGDQYLPHDISILALSINNAVDKIIGWCGETHRNFMTLNINWLPFANGLRITVVPSMHECDRSHLGSFLRCSASKAELTLGAELGYKCFNAPDGHRMDFDGNSYYSVFYTDEGPFKIKNKVDGVKNRAIAVQRLQDFFGNFEIKVGSYYRHNSRINL